MTEYENLAISIVIQAIKDYRRALKGYGSNPEARIHECEKFFHSGWCYMLCKIDGDTLIRIIKENLDNPLDLLSD